MMVTDFDLFGAPIEAPKSSPVSTSVRRSRVVSPEAKRAKLVRYLEKSNNLMLFDELLDFLKAPLLSSAVLATEYASDCASVAVVEVDDDEEVSAATVSIPYEAWGDVWVEDEKGLRWSKEGLLFTQVRLFWRSMEELAISYNEQDKWSVLKWIFRPAIWKHYVYDKRVAKSHVFEVHERDEPFSFHNCCIAARMDEDMVRDGIRRNIPAEVIKAVEKVCTFD